MPIYEFECGHCGKVFEELIMGSEEPRCPDCQSDSLRRLMSATCSVELGKDPSGAARLPAPARHGPG